MAWLTRQRAPLNRDPISKAQRKEVPDGLWIRCKSCHEVIFRQDFLGNKSVCPKCQYHYPIAPEDRITHLLTGEVIEYDADLQSTNPLDFVDSKTYTKRLADTQARLQRKDAFVSVEGKLGMHSVQLGMFDFRFLGGSMGAVVGEKIARLFQRSVEKNQPAIVFSSSGGARMQEGIISLMQMAKTCAALSELKEEGVPFISVLTNPTTGGVAASFAMLGDINLAEPGALIGFAGPRVIQQTLRQKLPEGFQSSEYLLEHGMVDRICHRDALTQTLMDILNILRPVQH